jgi:ABC-type transport system substrate-binding protein
VRRRLLACVALAALLSTPAATAILPRYGGTVVVRTEGPVRTLDPARAESWAEKDLVTALFVPLVRSGPGGFEPGAARSWSSTEGDREWTFTLRTDLTFTDGSAVDAGAVVSSLTRSGLFSDLEMEPIGAGTVRIRSSRAVRDLLTRVSSPMALVVKPDRPGKGGSLLGSGPFRLVGVSTGAFTLAPRLDHPEGRPFLGRVLVRLPDAAATEPPDAGLVIDGAATDAGADPLQRGVLRFPSRQIASSVRVAGAWIDPVHGVLHLESASLRPAVP